MHVRPYEPRDEDAVVSLWTECDLVRPWNDPRKDIARKVAWQPELFLVGVEGDTVIGTVMVGYDGHRGWINYLAVAKAAQRRGLGRQLMDHAERTLLAIGCPKINLQVRMTNTKVLEFYRAIGYDEEQFVSFGKRLIRDDQKP